jgi:hypothetical protein
MNPYMRFFLERSCQERKKGEVNWNDFSKKIAQEWKGLSDGKKKYYEEATEIRNKQRNQILEMYHNIKRSNKPPASPYIRFFKQRYAAYKKQFMYEDPNQITKLISEDWKKLAEK